MTTSMFKYTYRSELQGISSKHDLHAFPRQEKVLDQFSTQAEQTIIANQFEIRSISPAVAAIVEQTN